MRVRRFTEEHMVSSSWLAGAGTPVADVSRTLGSIETTSYRWKRKVGDLGVTGLRERR